MRALAPQDELLYNRIAAFYDYRPLSSPLLNLLAGLALGAPMTGGEFIYFQF